MAGLAELRDRIKERTDSLEVAKATFRNVVTGQIYSLMDKEGTSKSGLAKKLKVSKAAVSNLLSGDRNFTVDKLAHISFVLGFHPEFRFRRTLSTSWDFQIIYERYTESESVEVKREQSSAKLTKLHSFERIIARVNMEEYS